MSDSIVAVFAAAALVWLSLWLSVRAARLGHAQVQVLPARYRRRVLWWQSNATHVEVLCALVMVAAVSVQVGSAFA